MSMFVRLLPHVLRESQPLVTESLFHSCSLLRHTLLTALSSLPISKLPSEPQLLVGLYIAQQERDESNRVLADK